MKIITRDTSSRICKSKHIFLRENPSLKKLFKKLQKKQIRNIDDIQDKKIKNQIRKIMAETEVEWHFNPGDIPYMTFTNHIPMQGNFEKAIPKILKKLKLLDKMR